jgi:hypothetical protein
MSQQTIYLGKEHSKCIARAQFCSRKNLCALYLVSADGRNIADYIQPDSTCGMFIPASQHRSPPVVDRPAHEYIKGLT